MGAVAATTVAGETLGRPMDVSVGGAAWPDVVGKGSGSDAVKGGDECQREEEEEQLARRSHLVRFNDLVVTSTF